MSKFDPLDAFVAPQIRSVIEQGYYAKINEQCSLSEALKDPLFLDNPNKHVVLFSDHGVVHVRDVARQILQVLDAVQGVLIPARDAIRFGWMKTYGVLVAYIHDIGMIDLSVVGRAMHPECAAQAVLGEAFDDIIERLWAEDRGGIAARLVCHHYAGDLGPQPPKLVLREMLAMAVCHSKSKVPVALLNDPRHLRRTMQIAATTDLHDLYRQQQASRSSGARPAGGCRDLHSDAFAWLEASNSTARQLVEDVVDTLRALRCADALRQRGTVLKTSGNYEVFVDQRNASAIYALRPDDEHLYLLEISDPISAGEANLSSSELDSEGNLRMSFHHGMFADEDTVRKAARGAALVVNDIQADAIESFERPGEVGQVGLRRASDLHILIESADDNAAFAGLVCQELRALNPVAADRVRVVASLNASSALERGRYLRGSEILWDLSLRLKMLKRVAQSGHRTEEINPVEGLREVREIALKAGETLIESGTPSGFVYIPQREGLRGLPLGGYGTFAIRPWVPVGVTGVIRGSIRNAKVVAEQDLSLLAIPKDVYLKHWHRTYDQRKFARLLQN